VRIPPVKQLVYESDLQLVVGWGWDYHGPWMLYFISHSDSKLPNATAFHLFCILVNACTCLREVK